MGRRRLSAARLFLSALVPVRNEYRGLAVYNAVMPFRGPGSPGGGKKPGGKMPPPEDTLEEPKYLKALGDEQKTVSVKLVDGEVVRGWIEYYDKNMLRLTREGAPNLFIFKHDIVYIAEEGKRK